MRAYAVQKVAIMRNDDHRGFAGIQELFQPSNGIDVQIVGGLVEQQYVRIREQRLCEQYPELPARGNLAHGSMVLTDRDTDALQEVTGARFCGISVHFREFDLKMGDKNALFVTHLRERVDAITLLRHGPKCFVTHHYHVQNAAFLVCELVLRKLPDPGVSFDSNVASTGLQLSGQYFHQR